jgi:hypothetical protein
MQEDPKTIDAGDSNLRRYVGNDPTNSTDPSGLQKEDVIDSKLFRTKLVFEGFTVQEEKILREDVQKAAMKIRNAGIALLWYWEQIQANPLKKEFKVITEMKKKHTLIRGEVREPRSVEEFFQWKAAVKKMEATEVDARAYYLLRMGLILNDLNEPNEVLVLKKYSAKKREASGAHVKENYLFQDDPRYRHETIYINGDAYFQRADRVTTIVRELSRRVGFYKQNTTDVGEQPDFLRDANFFEEVVDSYHRDYERISKEKQNK